MIAHAFHRALEAGLRLERRIDPFVRPAFDAALRAPLTAAVQALVEWRRAREPDTPATEIVSPDEAAMTRSIVDAMTTYMQRHYKPGGYERGGNTKTHGVVRGRFVVHDGLPASLRHGLFAQPGEYPAWIRFAGPGPALPPDIDDVGVLSIGVKVMGVPGPKLLEDERATQDFMGISTPIFTTPTLRANVELQRWINRDLPIFYFLNPRDSHVLDLLMNGLWSRTQTSPLETGYFSCVPYLLGEGQAMRYEIHPTARERTRVPRLPRRPPDYYLREALQARLLDREARLEFRIQPQTHPARMPIENASVVWPATLSPPIPAATIVLPAQRFDSPAQLAFAHALSINPWHAMPEHRPLGSQNRARRVIYAELSRLRQRMNATPHREPEGSERFDG